MRKLVAVIMLSCAIGSSAHAENVSNLKLEKGTIIVKDFGEMVDLDELLAAFQKNGIKFNRIRLQGQGSYQTLRASYKGSRYDLTVDRQTGEISWVNRFGIGVTILD